jgi:hypothetical protein
LVSTTIFSCKTEKEEFITENIADYLPLTPGKYITYRVDSLVFPNFGRSTVTRKYQVKHLIDSKFIDVEGQTSYRVFTFIRDSVNTSSWTAAQPWVSSGTYFITVKADQTELTEDNLRFIKLRMPMKEGYSWHGNKYLPDNPYDTAGYKFSNDDNMEDWDFYYDNFSPLFSYRNINYANVVTVEQQDESFNVPITTPTSYASRTRSVEKYSKSIGLVYREYELWEYQPNTTGSGGAFKVGWGLTEWMIDHN